MKRPCGPAISTEHTYSRVSIGLVVSLSEAAQRATSRQYSLWLSVWRMESQSAYGELANKQVTRIGVTSVHDSRHQEARRKQRRTTWRELRVARPCAIQLVALCMILLSNQNIANNTVALARLTSINSIYSRQSQHHLRFYKITKL